MGSRPSFVGQFVTKSSNFGSLHSVFNSRFHGVVIREFAERSRVAKNRTNLYAEVMLFPTGRIEKIFKSKLFLLSEEDIRTKITSHPLYAEFQAKLNKVMNHHE